MLSAHESLSSVDLAWLRMERATNPMMVVAVLTLASRVHVADIRAIAEQRLLRFRRFLQIPVEDTVGAHWEDDPRFDIEAHVHPLVLPTPAHQRELEAAASELASTALDPRHPLWQIHVIERYRRGSAIIARFHHCYADGIALLQVLVSLTDATQETAPHIPADNHDSAAALRFLPLAGPAISAWDLLSWRSDAAGDAFRATHSSATSRAAIL